MLSIKPCCATVAGVRHTANAVTVPQTRVRRAALTSRLLCRPGYALRPSTCSRAARREHVVCATSSSGSAAFDGANASEQPNGIWKVVGVLGVVAAVAAAAALSSTEQAIIFKDNFINGPLGKSGLPAAFSLVFLSEIGDKTFFIAALLAMRLGRWVSFFGSLAALAAMTVISVGIGVVFSHVPDALKSSVPIGELCGVAMLIFFGVKALKAAFKSEEAASESELADAETVVQEAEIATTAAKASTWKSLLEVASLIFVAEWGDRSMLATIGLAASQNPMGVLVGATTGHAVATGIAVFCGVIASKYISEKNVNMVSGVLFLLFAAATVYGLL